MKISLVYDNKIYLSLSPVLKVYLLIFLLVSGTYGVSITLTFDTDSL